MYDRRAKLVTDKGGGGVTDRNRHRTASCVALSTIAIRRSKFVYLSTTCEFHSTQGLFHFQTKALRNRVAVETENVPEIQRLVARTLRLDPGFKAKVILLPGPDIQ